MFLHEPGEDSESFTRQDLSSLNAYNSQQYSSSIPQSHSPQPQPPVQHVLPVAAAIQDNDHAIQSAAASPLDGPALPATASWGDQARRASRATASSTNSPLVAMTTPAEIKPVSKEEPTQSVEEPEPKAKPSKPSKPSKPRYPYFEDLPRMAFNPNLKFIFAYPPNFTEKDKWIVENMPPLFDPQEGVRRRRFKEQEAEELRRQQSESHSELKSEPAVDDEPVDLPPGGSSQLGGEPEEHPDRTFGQRNLMSPQAIGSNQFGLGQNLGLSEELSGLGARNLGPQNAQQQALLLQQFKLANASQNTGTQANHVRQPSRFFETISTSSKNFGKQSGSVLGQSHFSQNQAPTNQFNHSSVQGPPPGLKTTGTPPVSGGGMFAQGHGFTQGVGYGNRETEKFWDVQRGRGGADSGKRELMFPSYHQHPSSSSATTTPGVLNFPYGSQPGALYQDTGISQKQKKKGKKHRHANTSSSGGGAVDVADPSIMQMRVGGSMAGQSGYGAGQGQAGGFPSSLHSTAYRGW
jgi:CCR4-NOT transcription complex subunit 4